MTGSPGDHRCPCGSGADLEGCCGPVIDGSRPALTALDLMRSRYTAYVIGDLGHLRRSWAPTTVPTEIMTDPDITWRGLSIIDSSAGQALDQAGEVSFVAHFVKDGRPGELSERSRFVRHEGRWVYLDAVPFR